MKTCCEVLRINGPVTHESGCTEAWRDVRHTCLECGQAFDAKRRGQAHCDDNCFNAWFCNDAGEPDSEDE